MSRVPARRTEQQVEGRRAVHELLVAGRRRVRTVWIAGDGLGEIVELARSVGATVRFVDHDELGKRARTEVPQGVVASAEPLESHELDSLLDDPRAFLVALDGVTDPQNLGAVIRSAEASGATGVVLPRHRSAQITPAVVKAAAGAIEYLPVATFAGIPAAIARAVRAGVWTVGLDAATDTSIFDLTMGDRPLMLVLGSESRGLSRLARERCDVLVTIPMHGHIASLNVAAAAAVACCEVARDRAGTLT
jgi:23S rRNA (guanosine2251-2'-O)-methyltransferase